MTHRAGVRTHRNCEGVMLNTVVCAGTSVKSWNRDTLEFFPPPPSEFQIHEEEQTTR
jgi:hypothetical protein